MKLPLNRVWDRTAALTGVSRSTAKKSMEEKKKAQDKQQQLDQPPSSTSKVSLDGFDQSVIRRTIARMYCLKKVLPTLYSRIRYLHGQGVREAGYTVVYTDETYVHTSHAVPICSQDSRYPFLKLN